MGLNKLEFGRLIGVPRQTISRIEHRKAPLGRTVALLIQVARNEGKIPDLAWFKAFPQRRPASGEPNETPAK